VPPTPNEGRAVKAESWGRVMRGAVTVGPTAPRWSRPAWIGHNVVHHQSVPNEQQEQRPATRPYSVRLLARHHVLHKPGDAREDRAASAAADDLTDDGSDIEAAAGRACDRWHRG